MGADHSKMWSQSTKGYFKIQGFVRNKTVIVLHLLVCFCMCVFFKDREYFVIQVEIDVYTIMEIPSLFFIINNCLCMV